MQTVLGQNMLLRQFSGSNANWYTGPELFLMHTNRAKVIKVESELHVKGRNNYGDFFFFSVTSTMLLNKKNGFPVQRLAITFSLLQILLRVESHV